MDFLDDPAEMTPGQRLAELAAILAAGYLRARACSATSVSAPVSPPTLDKPLDVSGTPRPPWDEGLTDGDPAEAGA